MRTGLVNVLLFSTLIISACSASASDVIVAIPRTAPSIIGQVTAIVLPVVVVEENPAEPHGSAKARVRIADGTQVLRQGGGIAGIAELRVGQQVKVWFAGPAMESYPLQATAGVILIEPSRR
jgi:hypothetical protein